MNNFIVKFRFISWIMVVLFLISCGPPVYLRSEITSAMNNIKGHHISEVVKTIGPPHEVTSDTLDGHIYIWSGQSSVRLTNAMAETKGTFTHKRRGKYAIKSKTVYTPPITITKNQAIMFWTDVDGIIYHWKLRGFDNIKTKKRIRR